MRKWNLPTATRASTNASNRVHEWDRRKEKEIGEDASSLAPRLHASIPHAAVKPGFTFNGGFIYLRRRPGESFFLRRSTWNAEISPGLFPFLVIDLDT